MSESDCYVKGFKGLKKLNGLLEKGFKKQQAFP